MLKIERVFYEGKNVGEIINDIIYFSRRKQSKHLFRGGRKTVKQAIKDKTACWGVSNGILEQLQKDMQRFLELDKWCVVSDFDKLLKISLQVVKGV